MPCANGDDLSLSIQSVRDMQRLVGGLIMDCEIGSRLTLDWQIGNGLADWHMIGICFLNWSCIGN